MLQAQSAHLYNPTHGKKTIVLRERQGQEMRLDVECLNVLSLSTLGQYQAEDLSSRHQDQVLPDVRSLLHLAAARFQSPILGASPMLAHHCYGNHQGRAEEPCATHFSGVMPCISALALQRSRDCELRALEDLGLQVPSLGAVESTTKIGLWNQ
mmetsp:Transcript_115382/g.224345  ORF Transcript_115382/g.224345 Transcript_115382/m.224345 type:complete len:154 (-) Transcript_115382:364-825(-)